MTGRSPPRQVLFHVMPGIDVAGAVTEETEDSMRRTTFFASVLVLVVLLAGAPHLLGAQQATPAMGTPAAGRAVGVTAEVLGTAKPAAAADQVLRLVRSTWAPGATVDAQTHPGALVSYVESGAHGFTLLEGTAHVTRAVVDGTPGPAEELSPGTEVVLGPGDVLVIDEDAVHRHRNASEGPTILWEAQLYAADEPAARFMMATPVP